MQISIGQTAVEFYKKGDSLYKAKDFENAALAFSSSFKLTDPAEIILVNNARNAAACSWSLANYPDSAFYLLNKIADTKGLTFSYFLDVITDNDFIPLYKEKRWTEVKEKMF